MILFQQGWTFWMHSENMAVHNIIVSDVSRGVWAMFIDLHAMNTCAVQLQCVYHVFSTQTSVDPYSAGKVRTFRKPWTQDKLDFELNFGSYESKSLLLLSTFQSPHLVRGSSMRRCFRVSIPMSYTRPFHCLFIRALRCI